MTSANLLHAMGHIDPQLIADAAPDAVQRRGTHKAWVKWVSMAACLIMIICAVPIASLVFGGSHSDAPVSNIYNSIEAAHTALGYDTLYSKLDLDESNTKRISISYDSINGDNGLQASLEKPLNLEKPLQLLIRAEYPNGETTDSVDYYVIFNRDSVDDSYIGGYEEQGLTKKINGVTVHYSLIQDGAMHGQAKFLYEGDLYVIDVHSWGSEYNLDTYIDRVLNGFGGEGS